MLKSKFPKKNKQKKNCIILPIKNMSTEGRTMIETAHQSHGYLCSQKYNKKMLAIILNKKNGYKSVSLVC